MSSPLSKIQLAIQASKAWLEQVVLAYELCPFARKPYDLAQIRFTASASTNLSEILQLVGEECQLLEETPASEIETTLIILESALPDFMDYWDFVARVEKQIFDAGFEGIFQVASFHPAYIFGGSTAQDPADFTNRSPFPMLHLLREDSLSEAVAFHKAPEAIPKRNIALMQEKGLQHWQQILSDIKDQHECS